MRKRAKLIAGKALLPLLALALLCCGAGASLAQHLSLADVNRVVAQAAQEAAARNAPATIAVTDRVGNVLAVYQMPGAPPTVKVTSGRTVFTGIDGLAGVVPSTMAAISKAVTGAYLSSSGNAFSTRTASQIVQENFNPGERIAGGGPLFGVQFSQLPCSDLNRRFFNGAIPPPPDQFRGPKRSPLGLSADAGGFPLYVNGAVAGGIGVIADGIYGLDSNVLDTDADTDEIIALAGTVGYAPARDILADRITVEGKTLRYSDAGASSLAANPVSAPAPLPGNFVAVTGYTDGPPVSGQTYGASGSGVRAINPATDGPAYANVAALVGAPVFTLVTGPDAPYFPMISGASNAGQSLSVNEVSVILAQALRVAISARAQIRRPLSSPAQVTVTIVDGEGQVLALARTSDAPIFGIDVSLQKARTAAFMSRPDAAASLENPGVFPVINVTAFALNSLIPGHLYFVHNYADSMRGFLGQDALANGAAYTARAVSNLSRPYFPDGVNTNPNGPLARPFVFWSPFSTGLQLDLVVPNLVNHILFVRNLNLDVTGDGVGDFDPDNNGAVNDTGLGCTPLVSRTSGLNPLANGLQVFAGGSPIYKSGVLVGGIGVSGDGIDQDDMVGFLGLHNASVALGGSVSHAPAAIRSDQLQPLGVRLRYVNCPFRPFLASDEQNVCEGK